MRDVQLLGQLIDLGLEAVQFRRGFFAVEADFALGAFPQLLKLGAEVLQGAQRRDVIELERYPYLIVEVLRR